MEYSTTGIEMFDAGSPYQFPCTFEINKIFFPGPNILMPLVEYVMYKYIFKHLH